MKQPTKIFNSGCIAALLGAVVLTAQSQQLAPPIIGPGVSAQPVVPSNPSSPPRIETLSNIDDEAALIAQLAVEIAQQQAQIAANQKLIEEKLAAIAENIRIAKIYVSRGGGAPKSK